MGNARRWKILMEWMRHLQETRQTNKMNFVLLQEKVEKIKRGISKGDVSHEQR